MPRKGHVKKRITPPDSVYANPAITKFINCLMLGGKKSTAERSPSEESRRSDISGSR